LQTSCRLGQVTHALGTTSSLEFGARPPGGLTYEEYEELFRLIREDWASEHYIRGPGAGFGPDADQAFVRESGL
jgi:hypothetical protein